ncbi:DUF3618 domain-containing protein [Micromonospora aurantiaca (nom. illeg.)]|uniref:DUF3618 domain-containing protein n=1 Tax=Micromonospora aurantiaca (nom. illeg.) TaxID=47850 RepID=UPI00340F5438
MSTDPEQIRREIEATRNSLSSDVDALAYKVSPSRIVDDRKQRVRSALANVKDKVMGTASDLGHSTGHAAHSVGDHASSMASTVGDKAQSAAATVSDAAHRAPQVVRRKSEGNPIAAGVIAFGVGMLVSSLIPATRREQQVAAQVKEKAAEHGGVVKEKLGEIAGELKEDLREPAQHAAESVKATAQDAVHTVKDDGRAAAQDVRHSAEQARS